MIVSRLNRKLPKFLEKTRSRRCQDEVKLPQDASEKSNIFDPQETRLAHDSLIRPKDEFKMPLDDLEEHPPRRFGHDALKTPFTYTGIMCLKFFLTSVVSWRAFMWYTVVLQRGLCEHYK